MGKGFWNSRFNQTAFSLVFLCVFFSSENAFSDEKIQTQPDTDRIFSNTVTHEAGVWSSGPLAVSQGISDLLAVNEIYNLRDYGSWLEKNFTYKKETSETQWHDPEEIFSRRFGDCKAYSVLNYTVLELFGYKPVFLAMLTGGEGHAVCAFETNGRIAYFDNSKLILTGARTMNEFEIVLYHCYEFNKLFKINPETKDALPLWPVPHFNVAVLSKG